MSDGESIEGYRDDIATDVDNNVRESIARYLEHVGRCEFGSVLGAFTPHEVATLCASWVRNRLDVKWAAEMAANTPVIRCVGPVPASAFSPSDFFSPSPRMAPCGVDGCAVRCLPNDCPDHGLDTTSAQPKETP